MVSTKISVVESVALGPPRKVFHCTTDVGVAGAPNVGVGVFVAAGSVGVAEGVGTLVEVAVKVAVGVEVAVPSEITSSGGFAPSFDE